MLSEKSDSDRENTEREDKKLVKYTKIKYKIDKLFICTIVLFVVH